jgi:ankyrin repeat protein
MTFDEFWQSIYEDRRTRDLGVYLRNGGDLLARDPKSDRTLLHLACEHQNLGLIRELVGKGIPIDDQDKWGLTPLHVAVDIDIDSVVQASGQISEMTFDTTKLLLSLGANPNLQDERGSAPRDWVLPYGPAVVEQFDRQTKLWDEKLADSERG